MLRVCDVRVCREKKAARAAGRVRDDLPWLGLDAVEDGVDERARREVLARTALHVLRVTFEETLVGIALHVGGHLQPGFVPDEIDDEPPQLRRVLDLVLRLAEDESEHPAFVAEFLQRLAVVLFELHAFHLRIGEIGPAIALRDGLLLAGERRTLVGHLQEEQERELF